jgi:hypothetical protein
MHLHSVAPNRAISGNEKIVLQAGIRGKNGNLVAESGQAFG